VESSEQKATGQRRENSEILQSSRKAPFRLRLRASLSAPNCLWDSNPLFITLVGNFQLPFEPADVQNRSGETAATAAGLVQIQNCKLRIEAFALVRVDRNCGKWKGPGGAFGGDGLSQEPPGPIPFQQRSNTSWRSLDPNPRFHGGSFGVWGTPPGKPLDDENWTEHNGRPLLRPMR
jgi:hypothetical protein